MTFDITLPMTGITHVRGKAAMIQGPPPHSPPFIGSGIYRGSSCGPAHPLRVPRLWPAIRGLLAGHELPDRLPDAAAEVLATLTCGGRPAPALLTTLPDAPHEGPIRPGVRDRRAELARR